MDTINPETQDLLAKLEQSRNKRHALQNFLSGTFMTAIVVLMVLLTLFNVYALNRLQSQTADLRSTVLVRQRLDANASANNAARNVKDLADDMADLQQSAQDQIARAGVSPAQARGVREDARLYLIGASQRMTAQTRNVAAVVAENRRVRGLSPADIAVLGAVNALRAFDLASADLIDAEKNAAQASMSFDQLSASIPQVQAAAAKMQALLRYRPAAEAKAGLAQVYFIVASRLNYPPAICDTVAALTAEAAAAKPYPLKVVINNADCLRKTGNVKQANAEFAKAVDAYRKSDPKGAVTPALDYRALRGLATTAIALPDVADKAQNDKNMKAAIDDLRAAAAFSKANGETPAQQQGILENIGFGYLRMGLYQEAVAHTKRVDLINPMVWNLTVQAIAAGEVGDSSLARDAREKLRAFRRQQFNECEVAALLGPLAGKLKPILESAQDAKFTPVCPKAA
ncbi:MAG TPA: hypothetical protein VG735_13765 [Caulobacterales bacterium]|nr:hypothetical protein [Caulobacterales bacterium]